MSKVSVIRYDEGCRRAWDEFVAAAKNGVEVSESSDFETFMGIEARVLAERHGARPVHTAAELTMLASRFPENIRLFAAHRAGRMIAGVVVYASGRVAHAQYIGATEE